MNKASLRELANFCKETVNGKSRLFEKSESLRYTDDAIRAGIRQIFGMEDGEKLTRRIWKNNKETYFELIEDVLAENLPLAWADSEFYNQFAVVKNGALGVQNIFTVPMPSTLIVSEVSGNHWTTERQKLAGRKSFSLPVQWLDVHAYEDLERFLKGLSSFVDLYREIEDALQEEINSRVVTNFLGAGAMLPSAFTQTGTFDDAKMANLIRRVQTATGGAIVIAGTAEALAEITVAGANLLSDSMKEEIHNYGRLRTYRGGYRVIEIPQTFRRGTYDFKENDKVVYVLPANYKPIQIFFEGEVRSRELTEQDTEDMTIDIDCQVKVGVGVVFPDLFGQYTLV